MDNCINLYFDVCSKDKLNADQKTEIINMFTSIINNQQFKCNLDKDSEYYKRLESIYNEVLDKSQNEKVKVLGYLLGISSYEDQVIKEQKDNIYFAITNHSLGEIGNAMLFNFIAYDRMAVNNRCSKPKVDLPLFEKILAKWGDPDLLLKYTEKFPNARSRINEIVDNTCSNEPCLMPCDDIANIIMDIPYCQLPNNKISSKNPVL